MKLPSYQRRGPLPARPRSTWRAGREGQPSIDTQKRLSGALNKPTYSSATKNKSLALLTEFGLNKKDDGGEFALLRQNHGKLLTRPPRPAPRPRQRTRRLAQLGRAQDRGGQRGRDAHDGTRGVDLDADVITVVEAESHPALLRFSKSLLPETGYLPYDQVMLIDGNDERGTDVGLTECGVACINRPAAA